MAQQLKTPLSYSDVLRMVAHDPEALLTPQEAAGFMRVDPKTVTRWANAQRVRAVRTPGGHRRIFAADLLKHTQEEGTAS